MAMIKDSKSEPLPASKPPYAQQGFVPPAKAPAAPPPSLAEVNKVTPADVQRGKDAAGGMTQPQILEEARKRAGTSNVNAGDPGGDTFEPKDPGVGKFTGTLEDDTVDAVTGAAPFIPPAPSPVQPPELSPAPNPPVAKVMPRPAPSPPAVDPIPGDSVAQLPLPTPPSDAPIGPRDDLWANIAKFLGDAGQGVLSSLPGVADDVMSRISRAGSAMGGTLDQNPYVIRNKQAFEQAQQQRELQKQRDMPSIQAKAAIEQALGVLPVETQEIIARSLGVNISDLATRLASLQPGGAVAQQTGYDITKTEGEQKAVGARERANAERAFGYMQRLLGQAPFAGGAGAGGVSGKGAVDQQFGNGNWRNGMQSLFSRPGGLNDLNTWTQQDQARSDRDLANQNATMNTYSNLLGALKP